MSLYAHQRALIRLVREHERYCFWYDTGTGKTLAMLHAIQDHCPGPVLVLCPLSITRAAWEADWERFGLNEHFTMAVATGSRAARQMGLAWAATATSSKHVLVMNYEGARASARAVLAVPWGTVIFDESTKLKSPSSKISRLCHALGAVPGRRVYALSGCPAPQGYMDYWSQLQAVRPGTLEATHYQFKRNRFWQPRSDLHWLWRLRPGEGERLMNQIAPHCTWLKKEECLDLPEKTDVTRMVQLQPEERRLYDQFITDWIVELKDGDVVAPTKLAELMKCRQFTAGLARLDNGAWAEIGSSKKKAVLELMEDIGRKPTMIVCQFRKEVTRYYEELRSSRDPCLLFGNMSEADRLESIRGFQDGSYDVMICHPGSMAHGLTFVNCSDMIFASLDYNYEYYHQVRDRIHRIGQHHPCTYYHLIAEDTIDEAIFKALRGKHGFSIEHARAYAGHEAAQRPA